MGRAALHLLVVRRRRGRGAARARRPRPRAALTVASLHARSRGSSALAKYGGRRYQRGMRSSRKERSMQIPIRTLAAVTALGLGLAAVPAHAFDLTGHWVGKWSCKGFDGGKFSSS